MTRNASFLRQVPVLADLADELLEQLGEEASERRLEAGEWLFREGDEGESLFVIRSGRLEIVAEGPPETLVRVLRRGDVVGELAVLRSERRSASARARRDTDLLELGRARFESMVSAVPEFALGLTRSLGTQLAASRSPVFAAGTPATVAILPLTERAPAADAARLLLGSLAEHGSATRLEPPADASDEGMLSSLARAETENDRVVLAARTADPGDDWTGFCLREADLVIAVSDGRPDQAWIERPEALRGCELLTLGGRPSPGVTAALQPRELHALDASALGDRMASLARRICGRGIGIVFSGGGARAFAHLGVYEELVAQGVVIDRIGGVSLGSVVGAGVALGHEPEQLVASFREGFVDRNPTGDYTLPLFGLIRGRRTEDLLTDAIGERAIEELATRYFCVSCDLIAREAVIHRSGLLRDAVRASLSIPGVFPPVSTPDGRLLVDGGVLDNLPVETMARRGEGPVIASDVTGRMGGFRKASRPGVERLRRPLRRYLTGAEDELPRLTETIIRTVTVGSIDTAQAARRHADLVIQPDVDSVGLLDWGQLDAVRRAGREAAKRALERAPGWLVP